MSKDPIPVTDKNGIRVLSEQCSTCIFHPGNRMHLAPGGLRSLVDAALAKDNGHIPCHDTLPYGNYQSVPGAICRGYWDRYADQVQLLQVAKRLGFVIEVPRPEDSEERLTNPTQ